MDHGDKFAREALTKSPAKFITLINACSNMAHADIAIRESRLRAQDAKPANLPGAQAPALRPVHRSLGEGGSFSEGGLACSNSPPPPEPALTAEEHRAFSDGAAPSCQPPQNELREMNP
jgi:hypothetical protein